MKLPALIRNCDRPINQPTDGHSQLIMVDDDDNVNIDFDYEDDLLYCIEFGDNVNAVSFKAKIRIRLLMNKNNVGMTKN